MLFGKLFFFVVIMTYADKTSIEICICSYWLQLFMNKFGEGLALSLSIKTEVTFLVFLHTASKLEVLMLYNSASDKLNYTCYRLLFELLVL